MFTTILSSIAGKIAIAGVALATTTGGLAAADALPAPAQQVVSDVAARIGISLPAPDDDSKAETASENGDGLSDETDGRVAPDLPEEASDIARKVIEIVFGGDPESKGAEFGRRVADDASKGNSGRGGGQGPPEGVPGQGNGHGPPDGVPGKGNGHGPPQGVTGPPPKQIPAGPPSHSGGGTPASPSSPRP